jgi:uncharacterized protein (TIGR02145 family)
MLKLYPLLLLAVSLFCGCISISFFDEDVIETCGGERYRAREQICEDDILKNPCGNGYYGPRIQFCFDNAVFEKCDSNNYNPSNQKCESGIVLNKCGNGYYNPAIQFCSNDIIYNKCNGTTYNVEIHRCKNDILFPKCGNEAFDPSFEYCVNDVVKDKEKFIDSRDGETYKYIHIGYQIWMAENLRYEISNIKCYDDDPNNCEAFGMLYDWNTAKTACPSGWHLPNDTEWNTLGGFVGSNISGTRLMANSNLWGSGNGTDNFGFTALPGGYFNDYFLEIGKEANFWSATAGISVGSAHMRLLSYFRELLLLQGFYTNNSWASIRCVKDCGNESYISTNQICENDIIKTKCGSGYYDSFSEYCLNDVIKDKEIFTDNRDGKTYKYVPIGSQIWMAENLRYETSNTKCYDDKTNNCENYGVMYDWNTAKVVCPSGWHLPNDMEWNTLRDFAGRNNAGTKLRAISGLWISANTSRWVYGEGTDNFGFTALPGGYFNDRFTEIGEIAGFWSATAGSQSETAHFRCLKYNSNILDLAGLYTNENNSWANVRCIKD